MTPLTEKKVGCQWNSKNKFGEIAECGDLPTKLAPRCGKYYCIAFHYQFGRKFKPFEARAK